MWANKRNAARRNTFLAACAVMISLLSGAAAAQVAVSISVAPPALPVYEQPPMPDAGYIWAPGYWAYGPEGYFWVPGTWVEPPEVGLLWTPGFWGWSQGYFAWNPGYWGPAIGFYGGVNYGFGYPGRGYEGGYWRGRQFYYNTTVNNVTNVHITNVYTKTVVNDVTIERVSYVGGPGGLNARPTAEEQKAATLPHKPPTGAQNAHVQAAGAHRELLASQNQGRPQIAATAKPGDFSSHVVAATRAGGALKASPAPGGPVAAAPPVNHARDIPPPAPRADAAKSAPDPEQVALQARQERERQDLAQKQERDHASYNQHPADQRAFASMEQQHQMQAQAMQQRHAQEAQTLHAASVGSGAHGAPPARSPEPAPHSNNGGH